MNTTEASKQAGLTRQRFWELALEHGIKPKVLSPKKFIWSRDQIEFIRKSNQMRYKFTKAELIHKILSDETRN